jgi:fumarylacetoacetate (FAA) hydrolase family protein
MKNWLCASNILPRDRYAAILVGRVWQPGPWGGPTPITVRGSDVIDLSRVAPTMSDLLEQDDVVETVRNAPHIVLCQIDELLQTLPSPEVMHLLAPCDLQPVKAAGVTFAASMLERVIEEQARGNAENAASIRAQVVELIGDDLARIKPGSPESQRLKDLLLEKGLWSQYLEVGIGPDAEVFTKAAPMSSVGHAAHVGLHPRSQWNNPEPEIVLAVNSRGKILGASLGNDVNLRDFEGRSALLLGKAKDNNGACAIGPLLRLFDDNFDLDDIRQCEVRLDVEGPDDFVLTGGSSMAQISRDPLDLVAQTIGPAHQYPDGLMLFCGTMFAPVQDRRRPGQGFTHERGDVVRISTERLGMLVNQVDLCDHIPHWTFGLSALMRSLAARGLLPLRGGAPMVHAQQVFPITP